MVAFFGQFGEGVAYPVEFAFERRCAFFGDVSEFVADVVEVACCAFCCPFERCVNDLEGGVELASEVLCESGRVGENLDFCRADDYRR